MAIVVTSMVTGCATVGVGPTPAEEAAAALSDFQAAIAAQDLEKIMASYSGDFNTQGMDKPGVRGLYEALSAQGLLQGITVGLEDCEIVVDGDTATATPMIINAPTGKVAYRCFLKKEADGVWRFVSNERVN